MHGLNFTDLWITIYFIFFFFFGKKWGWCCISRMGWLGDRHFRPSFGVVNCSPLEGIPIHAKTIKFQYWNSRDPHIKSDNPEEATATKKNSIIIVKSQEIEGIKNGSLVICEANKIEEKNTCNQGKSPRNRIRKLLLFETMRR
jgi:hypothetical protein